MEHCSNKILAVMLVPADHRVFKYKWKKKKPNRKSAIELSILSDGFIPFVAAYFKLYTMYTYKLHNWTAKQIYIECLTQN